MNQYKFGNFKHLKIQGNNREIGFQLGQIAKKEYCINHPVISNQEKLSCQRNYIKNSYPIHFERMQGLAHAYGEKLETSLSDYTCFGNPLGGISCSTVYYPPSFTKEKHGILSRNLDFPINNGTLSNPYIIELRPDKGYASLGILSFDLFGLQLDGINSQGLAVAHLHANNVEEEKYSPSFEYGVGINEMLVVQMLLDNCKDISEAKQWLWKNKHFYMLVPTHLIVADKNGNSFIWEYSVEHNKEYIIEKRNEINIITNFLIHKYMDIDKFPKSKNEACPFERYRTILGKINKYRKGITSEQIKEINSAVFITDDMFSEKLETNVRTLYHCLYDTTNNKMTISFYTGEEKMQQKRTPYYEFIL